MHVNCKRQKATSNEIHEMQKVKMYALKLVSLWASNLGTCLNQIKLLTFNSTVISKQPANIFSKKNKVFN